MIIANPIYDSVFKYLVEDTESAKTLLSCIIGEKVTSLEMLPQEQTTHSNRYLLTVLRVDFKAIVQTETGETKKILIELQKGKHPLDLTRFRRYLGNNYARPDEHGGRKNLALPLTVIYFLGFELDIKRACLKISRNYTDMFTGEIIPERDTFIESLTHDGYVVQIRHLPPTMSSKLEKILSIFNQRWVMDKDNKLLMKYPDDTQDPELLRIIHRLATAAASEEVRDQVALEEGFELSIEETLREKEIIIEERDREIKEKDNILKEKDSILKEKEAELAQLRTLLAEINNKKQK